MSRLQSQVMGIDLNLRGCRWQQVDEGLLYTLIAFSFVFAFSSPLPSFLLPNVGLLLLFLIPEIKHRRGNMKHSLEGWFIQPPQWSSLASVLFIYFSYTYMYLMSGHIFLSFFSSKFLPQPLLFSSDSIHFDSISV